MAVHVKSGNNTEQEYDEATSFVIRDGILYVLDGRDATLAAYSPENWRYAVRKD